MVEPFVFGETRATSCTCHLAGPSDNVSRVVLCLNYTSNSWPQAAFCAMMTSGVVKTHTRHFSVLLGFTEETIAMEWSTCCDSVPCCSNEGSEAGARMGCIAGHGANDRVHSSHQ